MIAAFMRDPRTLAHAVDLVGSAGRLLLFHQSADVRDIAETVDALFMWLGVPRGFTLLLFWRDDPRRIRADEWPSRRTVNGGWTSAGSHTIVVYRSEEYDRVVIHETIHALRWDWEMPSRPLSCWGLSEDAALVPALFEAWTELLAEWLWCGWNRVEWSAQRAHMRAQALQILARPRAARWREDTSVFAYYVLKAALAPHMPFLWVFQNGTTPEERGRVLCTLVSPELAALRRDAARVVPVAMSLRMTAAKN